MKLWTLAMVTTLVMNTSAASFNLLENNNAVYRIVIPVNAEPAEKYAAEELALFLGQATGASFATVNDAAPAQTHEILIGRARSFTTAQLPDNLRPDKPEGLAIYPNNQQLRIIGNTPRGTLYGVYELLEKEFGIRFLAPDYTYIPKSDGHIEVNARKYDPPLEYRNIDCDHVWAVRNRLNASWCVIPLESTVGGVKWVGPSFVHTFAYLVPLKDYWSTHPEYFSMVGGKRINNQTQLCLTNPEVLNIAEANIRRWIIDANKSPDTKYLVSISGNDYENYCECPACRKIYDEEKSTSGTLWRFINQLAERLTPDYPNVSLETLAYSWSFVPPAITKPHPRVVVRLAPIAADFSRQLTDGQYGNQEAMKNLERWSKLTHNLYIWDYHANFAAYFSPFPNLRPISENIRIYLRHGVTGYYAQGTQTPGGEMALLRFYMLARSMWKPETDSRQSMDEFCRLYYGQAASAPIIEYIDLLHETFFQQKQRLSITKMPPCMNFDDAFLSKANQLLAKAEKLADTPERRERVAVFRLPVWFEMLEKEFNRNGTLVTLPLEWKFKTDPKNLGESEAWFDPQKQKSGWSTMRVDNFWTKQGYENYHGAAWYTIDFTVPDIRPEAQTAFYFGSVDGYCEIWLDGQKIGEQKKSPEMMWDKGFYINVSHNLKPGSHTLTVKVVKENYAAGIWKLVRLVDRSAVLSAAVKEAAERFITVSKAAGVTHMSEFYGRKGSQLTDDFYPRIYALLNRKISDPTDSILRFYPSRSDDGLQTSQVQLDPGATTGACVKQLPKNWTLGQAKSADITAKLQESSTKGQRLAIRARVKVIAKPNGRGPAFTFGCRTVNPDWSGDICGQRTVNVEDCSGEWTEYTFSPLVLPPAPRYFIFGMAANNPDGVEAVYIDYFDLISAK